MKNRPNIIMILTDHWRGDSLSCLEHPVAETPHLDSISAQGVVFTNAFSPCPSCIAARRSIMTGMTPNSHGMLGYEDGHPWPYKYNVAGELAKSGYQTINVGKTHFHPKRLHLGFEELIVPEDYDEWIDRRKKQVRAKFAHGVQINSWMSRPTHLDEDEMEESWLTDQAMKKLEKRDPTRPFFMCLSFIGPHPPWCPPQWYFDLFMQKEIPAPVVGEWAEKNAADVNYPMDINAWRGKLSPELIHRARAGYYAYLAYLDAQIGRFVGYLTTKDLFNDSFILFTSDHGEMLGDHHLWRKAAPYNPSANVPFIIKPHVQIRDEVKPNSKNSKLAGLEDIMPTFLDIADVDIPETIEGKSLMPLIKNQKTEWRSCYHHEHSPCYQDDNAYQCLMSEEWKYIWNPINENEMLFHISEDKYELCNLSEDSKYSDILNEWREKMVKHLDGRPENFSDGEKLQSGKYPVSRDFIRR